MERAVRNIKGREKAAILLATIGSEGAARILQELGKAEIETLVAEIADLSTVRPEILDAILGETLEASLGAESFPQGGPGYAREVLSRAVDSDRAEQIITKVRQRSEQRPFRVLESIDARELVSFLRSEHPQTVALVLAHFDPRQASPILLGFPEESRADIAFRLATFEGASPDVVRSVEETIRGRLAASAPASAVHGGVGLVAEILGHVGTSAKSKILESLGHLDAGLAREIEERTPAGEPSESVGRLGGEGAVFANGRGSRDEIIG